MYNLSDTSKKNNRSVIHTQPGVVCGQPVHSHPQIDGSRVDNVEKVIHTCGLCEFCRKVLAEW